MPGVSCELTAGLKKIGMNMNLSSSAYARKSKILLPQQSRPQRPATQSLGVVAEPVRARTWWAAEAARTGTDWQSLAEAAREALVSGGIIRLERSTFELASEEADRKQQPREIRGAAATAAAPTT